LRRDDDVKYTLSLSCFDNVESEYQGEHPKRATLRQTQVLVIPSNEDMNSFQVFDELIEAINSARRSARDYVTDHSLEKLDERMYGEGDRDWM
jgi:hypothetical protein